VPSIVAALGVTVNFLAYIAPCTLNVRVVDQWVVPGIGLPVVLVAVSIGVTVLPFVT
jgi:hypothetical protein